MGVDPPLTDTELTTTLIMNYDYTCTGSDSTITSAAISKTVTYSGTTATSQIFTSTTFH